LGRSQWPLRRSNLRNVIDYDEVPGMFAAGYELNVPEEDDEPWRHVPYVGFDSDDGQVRLNAYWHGPGSSSYSVPSLRE